MQLQFISNLKGILCRFGPNKIKKNPHAKNIYQYTTILEIAYACSKTTTKSDQKVSGGMQKYYYMKQFKQIMRS